MQNVVLRRVELREGGTRLFRRLVQAKPEAADAYLGPGVENYLLSLKPAPLRVLLRVTGSNVDGERVLQEISETGLHGHYLEPFAKLLLAALRDNNPVHANSLGNCTGAFRTTNYIHARDGPHR